MSLSSGNLKKLCFLAIMDYFNHPDNCWKSKARITEIKQTRLLQSCDENFLIKMAKELRKEDNVINYTLSKELVRIMRVLAAANTGWWSSEYLEEKEKYQDPKPEHGMSRLGLLSLNEWHGM